MSEIILCGRPNACCPTINYNEENDTYTIKDDHGGKVQLCEAEMNVFRKVIKEGY